jgi:hypothetical protein
LLAAASHGLAGGAITPAAVLATAVLALPLCVLLSGRVASLWRLALAVAPAQFVFHWSFAGLGAVQGAATSGASGAAGAAGEAALPLHAHHLASLSFVPTLADAGRAGAAMWMLHAVAAIATIALLYFGERGAVRFVRALRDAVPIRLPEEVRLPRREAILVRFESEPPHAPQIFLSAISHRGPPRALASAH